VEFWDDSALFAAASPAFITTNLVFDLDAGNASSYSGSGNAWNDLSGNGFNATLMNSPGFSGGAITFNGTNQYATLPSLGMAPSGARTICAWIKPSSTTGLRAIFGYGNATTQLQSYILHLNVVNSGEVYTSFNNADYRTAGGSYDTSGYWNICSTYAGGALNTTNVKIYINGSAVASTPLAAMQGSIPNTINQSYTIARAFNANYFSGAIGRLSFYSMGLSAAEVLQNFNADKTRFGL
jgi:hypothetical protein